MPTLLPKIRRQITEYYRAKENTPSINSILFRRLGAILVGSGVILLVAHNWDILNKLTKNYSGVFTAGCIAQAICVYALVRKRKPGLAGKKRHVFILYNTCLYCHDQPVYQVDGTLSGFFIDLALC